MAEKPPPASAKSELRRELLAARRSLSPDARAAAAAALAVTALELPELAGAQTVAAYVSVGGEPGTRELLDALRAAGKRVLLPLLLPDNDLDWAAYEGPGSLSEAAHPGKIRLLEPSGPALGPDAVTGADAVLLPGLAV
ncbi:5-formyltetrahydrofolate cyclo-ligase, partial [Streptomyces sp. NPDC056254]|uniref:5-formyltetrahydrofolate cyclo-ligase n=1 Tax=Streptomyces sp. NPDC056254 TaxID=3345763 RepID=UPI0035E1B9B2